MILYTCSDSSEILRIFDHSFSGGVMLLQKEAGLDGPASFNL